MADASSKQKFCSIFVFAFAIAILTSCTSKKESSTVTITIPNFSNSISNSGLTSNTVTAIAEGEDGDWGLSDPSALAEFKCFGVFVGGPDSGLDAGRAEDTSGAPLFSFGVMKGLVGPGGTISLAVPSGPKRTISIIGFGLAIGATCESIDTQNNEITGSLYTAPFLLGQIIKDLSPGDMPPVPMTMSYTQGVTKKVGEVYFPSAGSGGGDSGVPTIYLGSGLDGDIDIAASTTAFLQSTLNQPMTRFLSTSARVPLVNQPSPVLFPNKYSVNLSGTSSTYSSMHFDVGDEVMLYISAEKGSGCGGKLFAGFRIPGKVLSAPNGNYMDVSFGDSRVATLPTGTLSNSALDPNFCRASITRVPQINKLTLNPGAYLKMLPFSGHSTYSEGGLMFLRVRDRIEMNGAGASYIWMGGAGYSGAVSPNYPGEGQQGLIAAPLTTSVGSGGGGGFGITNASGGGHGGLGGFTNGGTLLGDPFGCNDSSSNPNMHCLMGKIFMGGGGGAHTAISATNSGGGVISIFANRIVLGAGQHLNVFANGGNGNTTAAGGAGGAILVRAINLDLSGASSSALNIQAAGGISSAHGGGGGGRIHLDIVGSCVAAPGVLTTGIAGGSGNTAGASGTQISRGTTAAQCALPITSPAL